MSNKRGDVRGIHDPEGDEGRMPCSASKVQRATPRGHDAAEESMGRRGRCWLSGGRIFRPERDMGRIERHETDQGDDTGDGKGHKTQGLGSDRICR